MCVAADGTVWAGVAATFAGKGKFLHVVSYRPGDGSLYDHGAIAIRNPTYTEFTDKKGTALKWHHGVYRVKDTLLPRYTIMSICAARDGNVYVTTLYPLTLHAMKPQR